MEALTLNLRLLAFAGIVEPPCVSGSHWKRSLFSLYMMMLVLVYMPVLLGELLALYHFWGDLVVITNDLFTLVGNVTFYGEALYIVSRRKDFLRMVEQLQDMLAHVPRFVQLLAMNSSKYKAVETMAEKLRTDCLVSHSIEIGMYEQMLEFAECIFSETVISWQLPRPVWKT
jgi:hypothetical protein